MDIIKQFLETSTIHGLSHIVGSKSKTAKCLWTLTVLSGFLTAGLLINNSYKQWGESPIASTITTHSIANLPFPDVVVCPPKGTNTALNHDLIKVGEGRLQEEKIKQLVEAVEQIFLEDPHQHFAKGMIGLLNKANLRHVYMGHQKLPENEKTLLREANKTGQIHKPLQIETTALQGSFQSQQGRNLKDLTEAGYIRYKIWLPKNLKDIVGTNGAFVLKLSLNSSRNDEHFIINRGERFLSTFAGRHNKRWEEAESHCQNLGGHLASILSASEKKTLGDQMGFLGGKRINETWTWTDGSPFKMDNSSFELATGDCLRFNPPNIETTNCDGRPSNFWCKFETTKISGRGDLTLRYSGKELARETSPLIIDHKILTDERQNLSGASLNLKWYIEGGVKDYELRSSASSGIVQAPQRRLQNSVKSKFTIKLDTGSWLWNGSLVVEVLLGEDTAGLKSTIEYNILQKRLKKNEEGSLAREFLDTEKVCSKKGGHLPSIHSKGDLEAMGKVIGSYANGYWLGARRTSAGHWTWSDGSAWDFENWDKEDPLTRYGQRGGKYNCSLIWDDLTWWDWQCPTSDNDIDKSNSFDANFACQINSWAYEKNLILPMDSNVTSLTFSKETLQHSTLHVWVDTETANELHHKSQKPKGPTFQINWKMKSDKMKSVPSSKTHDTWDEFEGTPSFRKLYLQMVVNMVGDAMKGNTSFDQLFYEAISLKKQLVIDGNISFDWCLRNLLMKDSYQFQIVEEFQWRINLRGDPETRREVFVFT